MSTLPQDKEHFGKGRRLCYINVRGDSMIRLKDVEMDNLSEITEDSNNTGKVEVSEIIDNFDALKNYALDGGDLNILGSDGRSLITCFIEGYLNCLATGNWVQK